MVDPGLLLVRAFEGCRLKAYQDVVGVWTIGYGDTYNVKPGLVITQAEAEDRLLRRYSACQAEVRALVQHVLNTNQTGALSSFVYNLGAHALHGSTLLRKLNLGDIQGAANEFLKWDHAGGKIVDGLTRRRQAERALFLKLQEA